MDFFNYHLPPFLTVIGFFYLIIALPKLIKLLPYWQGFFPTIFKIILKNWYYLLILAAIILLIINYFDLKTILALKALDSMIHSYTFFDFICSCAEGGIIAGFLFSLSLMAAEFKLNKLQIVSQISLMSSILGGLLNGVFKFIFNRMRPSIGLDPWHFFAFFNASNKELSDLMYAYNSMPSGHTISTMAAIIPFLLAYKNKAFKTILIFWVLLIAFSRVYTINHWLSDVSLSLILGSIIGLAVYYNNSWRLKI